MTYSTQALIAGKKAWEKLSRILDDQNVTEFETLEEFDRFYSLLVSKLHNDDPDIEST